MAEAKEKLTLVTRKACFGLPTACPNCLPVYIYLRFCQRPFDLAFNLIHPDSDQIPYVESGTYVAYNNEKGGVIQSLKDDGMIDDLDSAVRNTPEWASTKAMAESWLADALLYELWLGSDASSVQIYYSDLPWPIGKLLYFKQVHVTKQRLGITKENVDKREEEIYRKASSAYGALSTMLGDQSFFFESRPTSLDAAFLGHALLTLFALPDTSVLRSKLLEHDNLVRYTENLKIQFIDATELPSLSPSHTDPSSSTTRRTSNWSSKPKTKPQKKRTEEEKKFRRRAKYFLVTQLVAVLVFLSLLGGSDDGEVELDDDDDGMDYD
nr:mitochondrial outer membrane import complex protein METAXIN [Ipomoea batatas]